MNMRILSLCLLLTLFGCQNSNNGGTTTGNPLISFTMAGSSAPSTVAFNSPSFLSPWWRAILKPAMAAAPASLQDANSLSVTLDEAWVVVKEVEFEANEVADDNEIDGDDIAFEGPYFVDLLSTAPESFGQQRISSPVLRRVKMKVEKESIIPNTAPTALVEKSFYWTGAVNGHTFTIASSEGYEYELGGPNGVTVSENSNILLSIHIANIFKKLNLADINTSSSHVDIDENSRFVTSSAPCPLIDASATDLYTCFNKGLKSEANLGRDDNNDAELEDEDTVK